MTADQIEACIRTLVDAVNLAAPGNQLHWSEIRSWLQEYLAEHEEEASRFPAVGGKPHWDLIAADADSRAPSAFIIALFRDHTVELAGGAGERSAVRTYGESNFPSDPREVIAEAARRFALADCQLSLPRTAVDSWLATS